MKHDPKAFGQKSAGEFLRETIARRRAEARRVAIACAGFALAFSAATGAAMGLGSDSLAVLFGLGASLSLIVAVCAASEA